jgi:alpha-glucosidase
MKNIHFKFIAVECILCLFTVSIFSSLASSNKSRTFTLTSPDKQLSVTVEVGQTIHYTISDSKGMVLSPSAISMTMTTGEQWGINSHLKNSSRSSVDRIIESPFYKRSQIHDAYNEIILNFKENFALNFRAYNDGIAYRFVSQRKTPFIVKNEGAEFVFPDNYKAVTQYVQKDKDAKDFDYQYSSSFENVYSYDSFSEKTPIRLIVLPTAVELSEGRVVCISDANTESYPGMFLNGQGSNKLTGVFAPYPKTKHIDGRARTQWWIDTREPYIAKVKGERNFPWRAIGIAPSHIKLIESDLIYKLADPCRIGSTDWIKPGKSAYEWWSNWAIYDVPFKAGINNNTYKYIIDFASKNKIQYILMDAGWSEPDSFDIMHSIPEIDIPMLANYATQKNVGIILWSGYRPFERSMTEALDYYSQFKGIKGFKVDFMDNDDQTMEEFLYKAAEESAKRHMILDFHGIHKNTGLQRTYPNVLNQEGAYNMEQTKNANKDMTLQDVTVPFVRMFAGPTDYLAGGMINAQRNMFMHRGTLPMTQGTRCQQLALFIVLDAPFCMMADSPTNYMHEQECTDFLAALPTVWDETVGVAGEIGEYIFSARRKGSDWYLGGMTNWTARTVDIDLSFLGSGDYKMEVFKDGLNADKVGTDYVKETVNVPADRHLKVSMAPGGGFAARIFK